MRMLFVAAGLLTLPLSCGPIAGAAAQDRLPCQAGPACDGEFPLRIANAADPGTPLIWSPAHGDLRPAPIGRAPILFGRTIPIGDIIGRRIRPIGRLPEPTVYNRPVAELGSNDPTLVLMPIGPAPFVTSYKRHHR